MSSFLGSNIGLTVWILIFGIAFLVLMLTAYLMRRKGVSLKPIFWFAGFIALIGLPQLIYHAVVAVSSARSQSESAESEHASDSKTDGPESYFVKAPEGATVVEIQPQAAAGVLSRAEQGRFITEQNGDTTMLARYASESEASNAVEQYLHESGLNADARPDGSGGYIIAGTPPRSAHVYTRGNVLVVQTSASSSTDQPNSSADEPYDPMKRLTATTSGKIAVAATLLIYVLFVSAYFLKGLAWATRIDAKPVRRVLSAKELRERILALNNLDVPFQVEPESDGSLSAIWRYGDSKWLDHARAHGLKRIHRILLSFNEPKRQIQATDYQTAYDWSAGAGGGSFAWRASTGIVLFQYEHERVFGLRFDGQGSPTPQISYAYTFNLQEMKSPLIETVTRAGWNWQPVAWQTPMWLRRLRSRK